MDFSEAKDFGLTNSVNSAVWWITCEVNACGKRTLASVLLTKTTQLMHTYCRPNMLPQIVSKFKNCNCIKHITYCVTTFLIKFFVAWYTLKRTTAYKINFMTRYIIVCHIFYATTPWKTFYN